MKIEWIKHQNEEYKYVIKDIVNCNYDSSLIENELWSKVNGFESSYMISNYGRVVSVGRNMVASDGSYREYPDRFLKLTPKKTCGYVYVRLYHFGGKKYQHIAVHRLVAMHFTPNPKNYNIVNHLDINRSNNQTRNLEWTTMSGNLTYKNSHLKAGSKRRKAVYQYTSDNVFIRKFSGASEASELGFSPMMIGKVCRGERKRYQGYIWSYT